MGGRSPRASPRSRWAVTAFGGLIAQIEAYSFGDIDGLIAVADSDQVVVSPLAKRLLAAQAAKCAAGGQRVDGFGPGGAPRSPHRRSLCGPQE